MLYQHSRTHKCILTKYDLCFAKILYCVATDYLCLYSFLLAMFFTTTAKATTIAEQMNRTEINHFNIGNTLEEMKKLINKNTGKIERK